MLVFLTGISSIKLLIEKSENTPDIFGNEPALVLAETVSFPESNNGITSFTARIDSVHKQGKIIRAKFTVLIFIPGENTDIGFYDLILAKIKCSEPAEYGVPGVASMKKRLRLEGMRFVCTATDKQDLIKLRKDDGRIISFINHLRRHLGKAVSSAFRKQESGFILAATLGIKEGLDKKTLQDFRKSGTAHILAISGMHVGIIAGFFYFLFRFMLKINTKLLIYCNIRRIAALLTMPFLLLFCVVSGMSPSVQRAFIMAALCLSAIAFLRKPVILYIACTACVVMLLINPAWLFDISFQLSFAAVFSIILIVPKFTDYIHGGRTAIYLKTSAITSIAGFLGTAPLISFYFKFLLF